MVSEQVEDYICATRSMASAALSWKQQDIIYDTSKAKERVEFTQLRKEWKVTGKGDKGSKTDAVILLKVSRGGGGGREPLKHPSRKKMVKPDLEKIQFSLTQCKI